MTSTTGPGYADQARKRIVFRILGGISMLVALVLIGVAAADFFASMTAEDPFADDGPDRFWMFFLALPFFAVGGLLLQLGFVGAATRYGAGETAPVIKDTARYLSDGRGVLGVGVDVERAETATGPFCRQCGTRNDDAARYCDSCGASMA